MMAEPAVTMVMKCGPDNIQRRASNKDFSDYSISNSLDRDKAPDNAKENGQKTAT